ncbi:hypothetical protein [Laribacter hongkongensis]|uniref:Uncharacterized protein n=1 Tax=Laribacter hongkongensis TaxID=168471 RepID=A0ABD4ST31_9NEIS|nr:hypothetical protein [Laribacter hongkongensis]MCG9026935.1 hypothetical protein [Laribacter hongkongensis]MCG9100291.1 hypothetical protein [Laribacter hongkongensis]MCG9119651.1 hypothetical protein [Laribacter hongkongensis]
MLTLAKLCELAGIKHPTEPVDCWPEPGCVLKPFGKHEIFSEQAGIYVHPESHWMHLDSEESVTDLVAPHPTGNFSEPAMALPCDLQDAIAFFECNDMEYHFQYHREDNSLGNRLREYLAGDRSIETKECMQGVASDASAVPGKQPATSVGRIAVEVAWHIECRTGRRADAAIVMKELRKMATDGAKPDILIEPGPRSVCWLTSKGARKDYTLEACGKTLKNWNASRA